MSAIDRQDGLKADLTGIISGVAGAMSKTTFDWVVTKKRIMNGFKCVCDRTSVKDKITLQVIVPDGQGGEIVYRQFGTNWPVSLDETIVLYKTEIDVGITIRVIYENTSIVPVDFAAGLYLHEETDT